MNFLEHPTISNKQPVHTRLSYVHERINQNLDEAIAYYRSNTRFIANEHVIVKLCNLLLSNFNLTTLPEQDPVILALELNDFAERHMRSLNIGTKYKTGLIQSNFYRREYLYTKELKVLDTYEQWEDLEPIKVMSHGRNDLSYGLVKPSEDTSINAIATLEIDLYKLLYMLHQYFAGFSGTDSENSGSVREFLNHFAFPNIIRSHIDVAWINRINSIVIEQPLNDIVPIRGLTLPGNGPYLDNVCKFYADTFLKDGYSISDMVMHLPTVRGGVLFDYYRQSTSVPTQSEYLWLLLSRQTVLMLALDLTNDQKRLDGRHLKQITKFLRTAIGMGVLDRTNTLHDEVEYFNAELISPLYDLGYKLRYF